MKVIIDKIKRGGIVEFLYFILSFLFAKIISYLKIGVLNSRGYKIDFTTYVGKNVYFFQSKKNAINISKNCYIGDGVRIKAGFDGEISVGQNVYIHDYSIIFAHKKLKIGDNSLISSHVFITDFNHKIPHSKYKDLIGSKEGYDDKEVKIGKNVWIGANSIILPGVVLGNDSVIGAGSVVTKSVPNGTIVVGNPAKIIKKI